MRIFIATVLLAGCASNDEGLKSGGPPETPTMEPAPADVPREPTPPPATPEAEAPTDPATAEAEAPPATPEAEAPTTPAAAAKRPEAAPKGDKAPTAPTPPPTASEEKPATTPPPPPPPPPPAPTKAKASGGDAKAGRAVWDQHCAKCHGKDGKGQTKMGAMLKIKDMTDPAWQKAHTDAGLSKVTREGNRAIKMPGFGADKIDDKGLADVVAFMRSLGR